MNSDMSAAETLAQARSSVDDIATIKEGRTVSLSKYRNIGIMAHIDAVLYKYKIFIYNNIFSFYILN